MAAHGTNVVSRSSRIRNLAASVTAAGQYCIAPGVSSGRVHLDAARRDKEIALGVGADSVRTAGQIRHHRTLVRDAIPLCSKANAVSMNTAAPRESWVMSWNPVACLLGCIFTKKYAESPW